MIEIQNHNYYRGKAKDNIFLLTGIFQFQQQVIIMNKSIKYIFLKIVYTVFFDHKQN